MKCNFYVADMDSILSLDGDSYDEDDDYVIFLHILNQPEDDDIDVDTHSDIEKVLGESSILSSERLMEGEFGGQFNEQTKSIDDVKSWLLSNEWVEKTELYEDFKERVAS